MKDLFAAIGFVVVAVKKSTAMALLKGLYLGVCHCGYVGLRFFESIAISEVPEIQDAMDRTGKK